jgi:hypothetical protein
VTKGVNELASPSSDHFKRKMLWMMTVRSQKFFQIWNHISDFETLLVVMLFPG